MPDHFKSFMIKMQGGKMYLPAAQRIVWFRDELGDKWGINTSLIEGGHEAGFATVRAEISNPEGRIVATGMKTESKSDFSAGWVEKAESGSIARALALLGFGTQFSPDLDEMPSGRIADSPQPSRQRAEPRPPAASPNPKSAIRNPQSTDPGPEPPPDDDEAQEAYDSHDHGKNRGGIGAGSTADSTEAHGRKVGLLTHRQWMQDSGLDPDDRALGRYFCAWAIDAPVETRANLTRTEWGRVNNMTKFNTSPAMIAKMVSEFEQKRTIESYAPELVAK